MSFNPCVSVKTKGVASDRKLNYNWLKQKEKYWFHNSIIQEELQEWPDPGLK